MKSYDNLLHGELTHLLIGRGMEVHRELGPGYDEQHYHVALSDVLAGAGRKVLYKPPLKLVHRGFVADQFEPDLVVDDAVVVELKAITGAFAPEYLSQVICYLKLCGLRVGLLLNFGLDSMGRQRVVFEEPERRTEWHLGYVDGLRDARNRRLLEHVCQMLQSLIDLYGLGYRSTTYRGLFAAELKAEAVHFGEDLDLPVEFRGRMLGSCRATGFVVDGTGFVKIAALQDRFQRAEIATVQTYVRALGLKWGLAANFGKRALQVYGVPSP